MSGQKNTNKKLSTKLCSYIDDRELDEEVSNKIRSLIEQGADVNFRDPNFDGNTPLHIAVDNNDVECVEFLLGLDVDLEIKNDDGETALDLAEKKENTEILNLLQTNSVEIIETFKTISSEYILVVETKKDFMNVNSGQNIKILKIQNCSSLEEVCGFLQSKEFFEFVSSSPGLFGLDLEIDDNTHELEEKIENILVHERSWIIQIKCGEKDFKIFYKEANESIKFCQKLENLEPKPESYLKLMKNDCNLDNFMQGFFLNFLGTFNENIFQVKLLFDDPLNSRISPVVAENDGLCFRFLLAFIELPFSMENEEFSPKQTKMLNRNNDKRFKILLHLIETDNVKDLKKVLESGIAVNRATCDVAWELKRFSCLVELLKADSPFPRKFDPSVHNFTDLIKYMNLFHEIIKSGSMEEVEKFVAENPKIKFAYNSTNKSALSVALEEKQIKIYAYLRSRGFSHGIDKNFTKILENLEKDEILSIEEENSKYFKSSESSHLFYILSNTTVAFNPGDYEKDFKIARDMLEELNEIEEISPILKAVEHVDLKIIFDFKNEGVSIMIPQQPEDAEGTCSREVGNVYVGAKDYENRYYDIMGTLIHEFSHYVMNLIYQNEAKPFLKADIDRKNHYNKIIESLKNGDLKSMDSCIKGTFDYHKTNWEAELIVRVPQLLAIYPESEIEEIKTYAGDLFDFFYKYTLEDVKNVSFLIQPKQEIKKLNKLLGTLDELWSSNISFKSNEFDVNLTSNLRIITSNAPTFSMVMILQDFFNIHKDVSSSYVIVAKLDTLNDEILERIKSAMNSIIKPHLIVNCAKSNETQRNILSIFLTDKKLSEKLILVTTTLEAEDFQKLFPRASIEKFVHEWNDLREKTQNFLIQKAVNFQGHIVELSNVVLKSSGSIRKICIQDLIEESLMNIGKTLEDSSDFFAPRKFLFRNTARFEQMKFKRQKCHEGRNEKDLIEHSIERQNIIWNENSLNGLLEESRKTKKMLISDMAGTGKTVVMKEIALRLKEKYPSRWVDFIDLKSHIDAFKKIKDQNTLSFTEFMLQMFYNDLNNFEHAVFEELYENGRITLFLDSFDEISPYYKEIVIKFIKTFEIKDGNQLWVTTRSHLEDELQEVMKPTIVKLEILSKEEQIEFLIKTWNKENFEMNDFHQKSLAENLIAQLQDLTTDSGFIGIPFLIKMVAKIYKHREFDQNEKLTFFKIYENFTKTFFLEWRDRGKSSKEEQSELDLKTGILNVTEVHQKFAVENIFGDEFSDLEEETDKAWKNEMISRVGIIKKNENNVQFIHKTFAEYFVARYLTELMKKDKNKEKFVNLFMRIVDELDFHVIRSFLNEAFENVSLTDKIQKELSIKIVNSSKNRECSFLAKTLDEGHKNIFEIFKLQNLEKSFLKEILTKRCNVFYHAAISPTPFLTLLFNYIENATSKDEAKRKILEMFQQKNDGEDTVIIRYFAFGKTEEVFDDLCLVLKNFSKEEIKKIFSQKITNSRNFLGCLAKNSKIKFGLPKIWKFLENFLNSFELFELLTEKETCCGRNSFLLALSEGNENFVIHFLDIIKKLSINQQKLLLKSRDNKGYNILHHACCCQNFSMIFDSLRNYLTDAEIKAMFQEINDAKSNILSIASISQSKNIFTQLFCCFEKITTTEEATKLFLEMFKEKDHFDNNILIVFFYLGRSEEVFDDLCSVLKKVANHEIKNLLLEKNQNSANIFGCLAGNFQMKFTLSKLWSFVKDYLDSSEIFELLIQKDINDEDNALHLSLADGNTNFVKFLFETVKLSNTERKLLIESEDKHGNGILHSACCSQTKMFTTIVDCLRVDNFLSLDDIRKMFWKPNKRGHIPIHQLARLGGLTRLEEICDVVIEIANEEEFKKMFCHKTPTKQNILHIAAKENNNLDFIDGFMKLLGSFFEDSRAKFFEMMFDSDIQCNTPLMLIEQNDNEKIRLHWLETLNSQTM